jgi:hypothetical protein
MPVSCSFPYVVAYRGLRVELSWEHPPGDPTGGADLDLHLHQPGSTVPWRLNGGIVDCGWANCSAAALTPPLMGTSPHWFADAAMPPTPVNWFDDPTPGGNDCYLAPSGQGQIWQNFGMGCHNPRLEADVITCDPTITDPNTTGGCVPELIDVDYPPTDTWMRIGVHYYSSHGITYDVHPTVKVYCGGHIAAVLGQFDQPPGPLTFAPTDGAGSPEANTFWVAADVRFPSDPCGRGACEVAPIYTAPMFAEAYLETGQVAAHDLGPPYPP